MNQLPSRSWFCFFVFSASLILLSFCVPLIAAQESGSDDSNASIIDLGRRSKMLVDKIKTGLVTEKKDPDSLNLGVELDSGLGVFDAFFASFSMILVSEPETFKLRSWSLLITSTYPIGDETFIIAALMAMRHPKSIVLSGALSALFVMTILSTGLGRIVPNLISRKHTNSAATAGATGMILLKNKDAGGSLYLGDKIDPDYAFQVEEKLESGQGKTTLRRFFSRFFTPIYLESFILTFLAEWGDRSQIATIALATHKNAVGVAVGATIGHTICTSLAVIGGSMLASKISQRTVATIGGLLFLGFSLSSYFYPPL
ncbi:GDT1-like protein 3 [Striga asiatica]|uniref:GDT1 family protein n=1 Tax=Striga asiatica TaxID=4170 RepID=A0A5A7R4P3_STRAF|nr:GDT1-like protein 3 [Striga asiatica]